MSLTIRDAADQLAINDLLVRYSHALDQEWWPLLDDVFTDDAIFDGANVGLGVIDIPTFVGGLPALYADRLSGVHSLGPVSVELAGDVARAVTEFTTVSLTAVSGGEVSRTRSAGTYFDALRRTADGWRISRRQATFKASVTERLPLEDVWLERISATGHDVRALPPV